MHVVAPFYRGPQQCAWRYVLLSGNISPNRVLNKIQGQRLQLSGFAILATFSSSFLPKISSERNPFSDPWTHRMNASRTAPAAEPM